MAGFLAELVVLVHTLFILFAVFGGLLVLRWKWIVWVHLPAAGWAAAVELAGWTCPLTPLETMLRRMGGGPGYQTGFLTHYLDPLLYPLWLTREIQLILGAGVIAVNALIYVRVLVKQSGHKRVTLNQMMHTVWLYELFESRWLS